MATDHLTAAALATTDDATNRVLVEYGRVRIAATPTHAADDTTVTVPLENGAILTLPATAYLETAHHEDDPGLIFHAEWVRERAMEMGIDAAAYSDSQLNYAAAQSFLDYDNCQTALSDMGSFLEGMTEGED